MTLYSCPTEAELQNIRKWPAGDFERLLEFVNIRWSYARVGYWRQRGKKYWLSTAGWSGNESIIGALQENFVFWAVCWVQSQRGGHYIFELPKQPAHERVIRGKRKKGNKTTR